MDFEMLSNLYARRVQYQTTGIRELFLDILTQDVDIDTASIEVEVLLHKIRTTPPSQLSDILSFKSLECDLKGVLHNRCVIGEVGAGPHLRQLYQDKLEKLLKHCAHRDYAFGPRYLHLRRHTFNAYHVLHDIDPLEDDYAGWWDTSDLLVPGCLTVTIDEDCDGHLSADAARWWSRVEKHITHLEFWTTTADGRTREQLFYTFEKAFELRKSDRKFVFTHGSRTRGVHMWHNAIEVLQCASYRGLGDLDSSIAATLVSGDWHSFIIQHGLLKLLQDHPAVFDNYPWQEQHLLIASSLGIIEVIRYLSSRPDLGTYDDIIAGVAGQEHSTLVESFMPSHSSSKSGLSMPSDKPDHEKIIAARRQREDIPHHVSGEDLSAAVIHVLRKGDYQRLFALAVSADLPVTLKHIIGRCKTQTIVGWADNQNFQALAKSAACGHARIVQELLQIDGLNPNSGYPLACAIKQCSPAIVANLMAHPRVDVNRSRPHDGSPLLMAISLRERASSAQSEMQRILTQHTKHSWAGYQPAHLVGLQAASCTLVQYDDIIRQLAMHHGTEVQAHFVGEHHGELNGMSPLVWAVRRGLRDHVKILAEHPRTNLDKGLDELSSPWSQDGSPARGDCWHTLCSAVIGARETTDHETEPHQYSLRPRKIGITG